MSFCVATTRKGEPCRNRASVGGRCFTHRRVVDEAAVASLVGLLRAGNYLEVAARAAGVELDALAEVPMLRDEIVSARAGAEAAHVARVAGAARDNWQAAAWLLERQYPERWGRPALRPGEESAAPLVVTDGLDELAGRRAARRATP